MTDPMLSSDPKEREEYASKIAQIMRDTIKEDRELRSRRRPDESSPPVMIGAQGVPSGINQSI